jgi:polyphosphate glucokinase
MDVLVVDVGGSHIKLRESRGGQVCRLESHPDLTPEELVGVVRDAVGTWAFDVLSLGVPGAVAVHGPVQEPGNLGSGWIGFDFAAAFGKPVRLVNDAVLQALGAYDGGRMLFLGLGTGLGSAFVSEHVAVPMELGNLRLYGNGSLGDQLGRKGLEALGLFEWRRRAADAAVMLREAFAADYVVLGGGNAERVEPLPEGVRRGGNEDAFTGGLRLWEEVVEPHDREPPPVWRVVR